jgi:hypothetical protein
LKEKYSDFDEVIDFIDAIKDDVAENASEFTESSQQGQQNPLQRFMPDRKIKSSTAEVSTGKWNSPVRFTAKGF